VRLHRDRPNALSRAVADCTVGDFRDAFTHSLRDRYAHADVER